LNLLHTGEIAAEEKQIQRKAYAERMNGSDPWQPQSFPDRQPATTQHPPPFRPPTLRPRDDGDSSTRRRMNNLVKTAHDS